MKSLRYAALLALFGGAFLTLNAPRSVQAAAWSAQYTGQSVSATVGSGDTATLTVDFTNTGTEAWSNTGAHTVKLGTANPRDHRSLFAMDTWLSPMRAATFSGSVSGGIVTPTGTINPGQTARFSFVIAAPPVSATKTFKEYFQPVVEGIQWMSNMGQYFPITVTPKSYTYAYVAQTNPPPVLQPGDVANATLDLQNTGTATWRNDAATAFRIGTSHPMDRSSTLYGDEWPSRMRLPTFQKLVGGTPTDSATIAPGETARFSFTFKAHGSGGSREYFQPLVERAMWLPDSGIYYPVRSWRPITVGLAQQGQSPTITSTAGTTLRSDTQIFASPSAGTTITLGYASGTYAASIPGHSYTSSTPIRVEQPTGGIATVGNLGDGSSNNRFRGFLYLDGQAGLWLVNKVDLEDYTKGQGEVPDSWPLQAIKAQVVAFRTYGAYKINHPRAAGYAVSDSSDQVYGGYNVESAKPNTATAVSQTAGQAIFYSGQLTQAFYATDTGGASESNENVWGGSPIAYLRGKSDPYKATGSQITTPFNQTISDSALRANLGLPGPSIQAIQFLANYPSGRRKTIRFIVAGANHDFTYLADTWRDKLSMGLLRSDLIVGAGKSGSTWTFATKGFGHGLGMGQWGAYNQATGGRNFIQILQYYYTGVSIGSL